MKIVVLGAPGSGKGTQAGLLSDRLGIPHISTGDLFRTNIKVATPLGISVQKYLTAGELVPADLTNDMVKARLAEPDTARGFILDGYPRSIAQAQVLNNYINDKLDAVLFFDVPEAVVMERMLLRGRSDDTQATITNRLKIYEQETKPILDFYNDLVINIDANGEIKVVFERILTALQLRVDIDGIEEKQQKK